MKCGECGKLVTYTFKNFCIECYLSLFKAGARKTKLVVKKSRKNKKYSKEEDRKIKQFSAQGLTDKRISLLLGRTEEAIRNRISLLNRKEALNE